MRVLLALPLLLPLPVLAGSQAEAPGVKAETVTYRAGKDTVRALRFLPAGKGPFPAVIVVHGDFGVTKWVKEQARRFAEKGYAALAVDLYRGDVAKDVEEAHILERGLDESRARTDLRAAVDYLAGLPEVRKDRIGILGWDMGGGHALEAAARDRRLRALVTCYGRLVTDPARLAGLQAPVLGIFAGKDEGIPPETIKRFRAALEKAGKRVAGLHVYPDCENGFLDPGSPYLSAPPRAAAVADAWRRIDQYFTAELKR
jgi:carboxymethylenebutenolidase